MILSSTSPAAAMRFTPRSREQDAAPPVFLLRAGTIWEREEMESELAGQWRAAVITDAEREDVIVSGFRAIGGPDSEYLISLAEGARAGLIEDAAQHAVLAEALDVLSQNWPDLRRLLAQDERRDRYIPLVAFRRFCCGWENIDVPFALGHDRCVSEAAFTGVAQFDMGALRAAGVRAYLLQYGAGAEKNSDAPSKSGDALEISTSGAESTADGSLPESDTPKTQS